MTLSTIHCTLLFYDHSFRKLKGLDNKHCLFADLIQRLLISLERISVNSQQTSLYYLWSSHPHEPFPLRFFFFTYVIHQPLLSVCLLRSFSLFCHVQDVLVSSFLEVPTSYVLIMSYLSLHLLIVSDNLDRYPLVAIGLCPYKRSHQSRLWTNTSHPHSVTRVTKIVGARDPGLPGPNERPRCRFFDTLKSVQW